MLATLHRLLLATAALTPAAIGAQEAEAPVRSQIFGDWVYQCETAICQSFVSLADAETGERRLAWSMVYDRESEALTAIVNLPLGVALPPGARLRLLSGEIVPLPYQVCDADGCRAVAPVTGDIDAALRSAGSAVVEYVTYGRNRAERVQVPLDGYGPAIDALKDGGRAQ
jgi:invasion protein IalB